MYCGLHASYISFGSLNMPHCNWFFIFCKYYSKVTCVYSVIILDISTVVVFPPSLETHHGTHFSLSLSAPFPAFGSFLLYGEQFSGVDAAASASDGDGGIILPVSINYAIAFSVPVMAAAVAIMTRKLKHLRPSLFMFWFGLSSFLVAVIGKQ